MSAPTSSPLGHLSKGSLLIASPEIDSGIYFRAVILICEHTNQGSFGIMINKPLHIELPEEVVNLKEAQNPRIQVRAGGALQPNQMMLLHTSSEIPEESMQLSEGIYLGGDLEFLQEALSDEGGPAVHLCFGYAGWGPAQLEREILSGLWFLCPGREELVFTDAPERLWQTILRQMGGKYATLSMIPEDLSLN